MKKYGGLWWTLPDSAILLQLNDTRHVAWALDSEFLYFYFYNYVKFIASYTPAYPPVGDGFIWGTISQTRTPTPS